MLTIDELTRGAIGKVGKSVSGSTSGFGPVLSLVFPSFCGFPPLLKIGLPAISVTLIYSVPIVMKKENNVETH